MSTRSQCAGDTPELAIGSVLRQRTDDGDSGGSDDEAVAAAVVALAADRAWHGGKHTPYVEVSETFSIGAGGSVRVSAHR